MEPHKTGADEDQLRIALTAAGIGTWFWDRATGRVTCSATHERLCGMAPGSFAGTMDALFACVHPDDRERVRWAIAEAVESRSDFDATFRVVWSDESVHELHSHARVLVTDDGEPSAITGLTQDVTAEHLAREALRRSEQRYRSLALATSETVWTTKPNGETLEDSPTWRAYTGQSHEQFWGYGWLDAVHPDDRPRVLRAWARARHEKRFFELEYRARRHDGEYRDFHARAAPVLDGGELREWIGTTTDVTYRNRAAEEHRRLHHALELKRARLETVLNAMPSGVVIAEAPDGRVTYANRQAEAITRRPLADGRVTKMFETLGARTLGGELLRGEDYPLSRALRGEVVRAMELACQHADGETSYIRVNSAPVRDPQGRIVAAVSAFEEITDEIEAKQQRDRVERFRELFLGMLGHDLRTPLNAILIAATAVLKHGRLPSWEANFVERIVAAGTRMTRMIDQILDLTRSRLGGGIPVVPQPISLGPLIARIVDELEAANPGRSVFVDFQGDLRGYWDPDRLGQVLANLIGNALVHTQPEVEVEVHAERVDDAARVVVHNLGAPIPREILPQIFDPFRRSASSARAPGQGLGLGLYISQQIVQSHGGTLEVTSTAEAGTTFTVTLPLDARERAKAA